MGMSEGPDAGLEILAQLQECGALAGYFLLPATAADLHRRAGRSAAAAQYYQQAIDLAPPEANLRFLRQKQVELSG